MMQKIKKLAENGEEFNIYEILEGLTMDTIDRCAFSIQTDIQANIRNPLMDATRGVFSVKPNQFLASLLLCLPEFSWIINILRDISETFFDYFELTSHGLLLKAAQNIVFNRTKNKNFVGQRQDMLALMTDSRHNIKSNKSLSDIEIIANTIVIHEGILIKYILFIVS